MSTPIEIIDDKTSTILLVKGLPHELTKSDLTLYIRQFLKANTSNVYAFIELSRKSGISKGTAYISFPSNKIKSEKQYEMMLKGLNTQLRYDRTGVFKKVSCRILVEDVDRIKALKKIKLYRNLTRETIVSRNEVRAAKYNPMKTQTVEMKKKIADKIQAKLNKFISE